MHSQVRTHTRTRILTQVNGSTVPAGAGVPLIYNDEMLAAAEKVSIVRECACTLTCMRSCCFPLEKSACTEKSLLFLGATYACTYACLCKCVGV